LVILFMVFALPHLKTTWKGR